MSRSKRSSKDKSNASSPPRPNLEQLYREANVNIDSLVFSESDTNGEELQKNDPDYIPPNIKEINKKQLKKANGNNNNNNNHQKQKKGMNIDNNDEDNKCESANNNNNESRSVMAAINVVRKIGAHNINDIKFPNNIERFAELLLEDQISLTTFYAAGFSAMEINEFGYKCGGEIYINKCIQSFYKVLDNYSESIQIHENNHKSYKLDLFFLYMFIHHFIYMFIYSFN